MEAIYVALGLPAREARRKSLSRAAVHHVPRERECQAKRILYYRFNIGPLIFRCVRCFLHFRPKTWSHLSWSVLVCPGLSLLSPSVTICHRPSPSVTVRHRLSPPITGANTKTWSEASAAPKATREPSGGFLCERRIAKLRVSRPVTSFSVRPGPSRFR